MKCNECDGTGALDKVYACHKCDGKGETDWVTNAMHKDPPARSSLQLLQIKQMLIHIEKMAIQAIEEINFKGAVPVIKEYLQIYKAKKVIYDWDVICDESNFHNIDVYMKPTKTLEYVRLTLKDLR